MKLFRSKLDVQKDEIDYQNLNEFPAEVKILVTQTQSLVDETQEKLKRKGVMLDLTCKRQLNDDCRSAEKVIVKLSKCKNQNIEKIVKELENAKIRLETTSKNILGS